MVLAVILRIRIERLARNLPSDIITASPKKLYVERRLMLSVGAPGLDGEQRQRRLRLVRAAAAAYRAICDVLHGRNPEFRPPLDDTTAWAAAVAALEVELG